MGSIITMKSAINITAVKLVSGKFNIQEILMSTQVYIFIEKAEERHLGCMNFTGTLNLPKYLLSNDI